MSSDTKTRVIEILAEQAMLDPADVGLDSTLKELGVDSLALVETIFAIEEAFDIDVPFNANDPGASNFDLTSVASICAAIDDLVLAKAQ